MFRHLHTKTLLLLRLFLPLSFGLVLISCTPIPNEAESTFSQAPETPVPIEPSSTPIKPTVTVTVGKLPTEKPEEATPTAVDALIGTDVITAPTLLNIDIPLVTGNLPDYGWFSEDSQVAHFAYPEEGVAFSYDIITQQLISTTLSQKSDDQIIEQITAYLPVNARVLEISPKHQNILYTVPISQPTTLERGAFTVPLDNELWLYKEEKSTRLGVVDECFLINFPLGVLWSPAETLATVNAFAAMPCAWNNWIIDLDAFSVTSIDEYWEEGNSGFSITAILPNNQLLLTAHLQRESSAIFDLQSKELTVLSDRGSEMAKYFDDIVLLDLIFSSGIDGSKDETEVWFSSLNERNRQLIGTTEGLIRAKYVSPNQKHVLLFSGSPDHYGLSKNQESSGVWLLSFP